MMDCPRCGFSQPKDQFCANCGVNLDQFTPKSRPFYESWFSNVYFLGVCGLLVVGAALFYLNQQRPNEIETESSTITRDEMFTEEQRLAEERQAQGREQQKQNAITQLRASETAATEVAAAALTPEPENTSLVETTTTLSSPTDKKLQIRFFEIGQKGLSQIFASGKVISETLQSRTVLVEHVVELESTLQASQSLPGTKTSTAQKGETIEVFYSKNDDKTGSSWEVSIEFQIGAWMGDTLTYQFSGGFLNTAADKVGSPIDLTPETHQLPISGAIVVAGLLPHNIAGDAGLFKNLKSPLKILGSPDFRESLSEFITVIQIKSPSEN